MKGVNSNTFNLCFPNYTYRCQALMVSAQSLSAFYTSQLISLPRRLFVYYLLGARPGPKKSFLFASHAQAREWLRGYNWPLVDTRLEVKQHFRDLGAHLDFSGWRTGVTLTKRIRKAAAFVWWLSFSPTDPEARARYIRTKGLPFALSSITHYDSLRAGDL